MTILRSWKFLSTLASVAVLSACAAQQPPRSKIVWQKSDGTTPSRDELNAAASECKAVAGVGGGGESGRFATNAWAAKAIQCMKERGFERVEVALPTPPEADE